MPTDLKTSYLHLQADRSVRDVPVTPTFWQEIGGRTDLQAGRMLMRFDFDGDWPTWEVHPAGDEVVICIAGGMTFFLEQEDGVQQVPLAAGEAVVVPRGVWHTADVPSSASALFLTPGEGTQNRPR